MKRLLLALTATAGLFSLSTAHAVLGFSFGAHIGTMELDGTLVDDDQTIVGANVGYKFKDFVVADLAVDVELNKAIDDFDVATASTFTGADVSYESGAIFLTTKTLGPIYAIGRAGIVRADIGPFSDNGTALSVGVGFSLGTQIELLYKSISFDEDFLGDGEQILLRIGF